MTVPLLVQIDKLVMLIESPVFTCKLPNCILRISWTANKHIILWS